MKVAVVGSRSINDFKVVKDAIEQAGFDVTEIVSGGARGVDSLAAQYAKENNIPIKVVYV